MSSSSFEESKSKKFLVINLFVSIYSKIISFFNLKKFKYFCLEN
ncbi:hypothetical protein LEP1GSC018_1187 [Leptospira kirschneri str. 2008720114]|nr:hypothetical protein LEP1GSC018_1187 [Leptospira kirschneri str. 2008720114]